MRIAQLIDSLDTGGAERMAVNYANALAIEEFSALVATRREGPLRDQVGNKVSYLFLNRKHTFDFAALIRLKKFIKSNKIDLVHAHSTSFLLAVLLKFIYPKIKIIWHDHYGNSEFLGQRKSLILKLSSVFFSGAIGVNSKLVSWGLKNLNCRNIIYLPNFVTDIPVDEQNPVRLNGIPGKRIICLANLRPQKGHLMLLEVAEKLKKKHPEWTFHLVGKDFKDEYSEQLISAISSKGLENNVFIYGAMTEIKGILQQSDIGILTSRSEGLPVALLEYGLYKLPVVCTGVGEIPQILNPDNGFLIDSGDAEAFYNAIHTLITDNKLREKISASFNIFINANFAQNAVLDKYINWAKTLL
ncbi:MAG TPA: glycosyltransferase [Flavobacterium sp.]|jgi:glycosyltransferase involved in cell wall biosynthesis